MKPIEGFKAEAPRSGYPMLPKGLYIAKITGVKLDGTEPDQRLVIRVDITEGEFTGYYKKRYDAEKVMNSQYETKYKGDYNLQIPDKNNPRAQHFDWDLNKFNAAIWAVEDSNPGYHWDWNEASLKGKTIGINVQQGVYNGNPYTRIGRLESVNQIREGKCKLMKDAAPRTGGQTGGTVTAAAPEAYTVVDDEVPF